MIYTHKNLEMLSFPLGGIGTGSVGLTGSGRLVGWEIFNRPARRSLNGFSHFAIKAKTSQGIQTRMLHGDLEKNLYNENCAPDYRTLCGFPHFKEIAFQGEFPIAKLTFTDANFPGEITMTAFNPFIPLDADNSSIPAAFFEFEVKNPGNEEIEYQLAFTVRNPFDLSSNTHTVIEKNHAIHMTNAGASAEDTSYGDLAIATNHEDVLWQTYWYRGGWRDPIVSFWNDFHNTADLQDRIYDTPYHKGPYENDCDCGTLVAKLHILPNHSQKVRFILAWNVPNNYRSWNDDYGFFRDYPDKDRIKTPWKNYYSTLFENALATATYALTNWDSLYDRTLRFKESLFQTTIDETVINAVSANMAILKSPTVLRLADGSFYGWEGIADIGGCCEGTCQHVWNYAYALCFLFPELERSIRDLEFKYCLDEDGRTAFRLILPLGTVKNNFPHACTDGQLGTIIKCYREWKLSGNDAWLRDNWNNITRMLEYCWSESNTDEWDRNKDGILEGWQHHTLDMELFGPSSWLQSIYLGALKAAAEMADYLGDTNRSQTYSAMYENGYRWTKENLFNGSYFIQKIDLKDKSILDHFNCLWYWNSESEEIKYQIAEGSAIDQMHGQWHCTINGLGNVLDQDQMATALSHMMKNNYKSSMREFANPWRSFAFEDDAGSVICDYPEDIHKPRIPISYCEETMHGFEYQFAGLLFAAGKIEDGIKVVKAIRDKYDGQKRNPWSEAESGRFYARSMASFAMLPILCGFDFHLPKKHIGFDPKVNRDNFKGFFSVGTGWGTFSQQNNCATIQLEEGSLCLKTIGLPFAQNVTALTIDGQAQDFTFQNGILSFSETTANSAIQIAYEF